MAALRRGRDDCEDIDGATGTTYVLTAADACMTLQVAETVTNASGAGTAISDPTNQVLPCLPANSVLPAVAGPRRWARRWR